MTLGLLPEYMFPNDTIPTHRFPEYSNPNHPSLVTIRDTPFDSAGSTAESNVQIRDTRRYPER